MTTTFHRSNNKFSLISAVTETPEEVKRGEGTVSLLGQESREKDASVELKPARI